MAKLAGCQSVCVLRGVKKPNDVWSWLLHCLDADLLQVMQATECYWNNPSEVQYQRDDFNSSSEPFYTLVLNNKTGNTNFR